MQFFRSKSYTEACSLLSPYLSEIEAEGFATRKRLKPVGRYIYNSFYTRDSILKLLKGKTNLSILLAFDGEVLQGLAIGAPIDVPATTAFGIPWTSVHVCALSKSKVLKLKSLQAYHRLIDLVEMGETIPVNLDKHKLYELVFLATRAKSTFLLPTSSTSLANTLTNRLLDEASKEGYTLCLGEASASTHIGSLRLAQKVYMKWGFDLYYLKDVKEKTRLTGPFGDYFVIGKSLEMLS